MADPNASRYAMHGEHVKTTLDADIDELRARIAELEARLEALTMQQQTSPRTLSPSPDSAPRYAVSSPEKDPVR